MGSFHLSWIIISAIYVSCQELKISLPEGSDACARREVTLTCTIRGSPNLTSLILAWSSPEYIGNPLRFVSVDTRGTNTTSMINRNVIAILTNNTRIGGVPVLVSELHIVGANQRSVITCESVTNESSASTEISIPAIPGQPINVEARHLSAGSCDFIVTWNPTNTDRPNIDRYIVYVPLRNIAKVEFSTTTVLNVSNCRNGGISVQVAAVNSVGCEGLNSTAIEPNLLEMPTTSDDTQTSTVVAGAVVSILLVIISVIVIVVIIVGCYYKRHLAITGKEQKLIDDQKKLIDDQKKLIDDQKLQDEFRLYLIHLLVVLNSKFNQSTSTMIERMIKILETTPPTYIKEALLRALNNIVWERDGQYMKKALVKLKKLIPEIIRIFDEKLKVANVTISNESDDSKITGTVLTVEKLVDEVGISSDRFRTVFLDRLIPAAEKAPPESVKDLLQKMCKQLQAKQSNQHQETYIDIKPRDEHQEAFEKMIEKVSPEQAKDLLLKFINTLKEKVAMEAPDGPGAISPPRKPTSDQSNGRKTVMVRNS